MLVITRKRAMSSRYAPARFRKAQPTVSQVHVNTPLTNISIAYLIDPNLFVASRAFAHVPVAKQSDVYYRYNKDDFLRDEARVRGPASESAGGGFALDTDSYSAQVVAYHKDVDDQMRTNADSVLQLDSSATRWVSQKMLIFKEKKWVSKFFGTGIWGTDVTGVTGSPSTGQFKRWDAASSTPKLDVLTGVNVIHSQTGLRPNVLVIDPYTLAGLQNNADVRDQFKYTSPESITLPMLARYFMLDEVLLAGGVASTTIEGAATPLYGFIAGKNALLAYRQPAPDLMAPSAGYVFTWNAYAGSQQGATITKFRMQQLRSDRIEGEFAYDMKKVAADCGYFFSATVS